MKKSGLYFLVLLFSIHLNAQDRTVLDLKNNNEYATFSFFDSLNIKEYNLFFTGEDHRYPLSNSDLELKMFKYLHQKVGVRVFMVEFGNGMAYFINRYISQNDSVAKTVLREYLRGSYFKLFTHLREFYTSLPESERFTVIGVDIEREPMYAIKYLDLLLPQELKNIDDSIKVHMEAVKALAEYYSYHRNSGDFDSDRTWKRNGKIYLSPQKTLTLFLTNFDTHNQKYVSALKENYALFATGIQWLQEYRYWQMLNSSAQMYLYRENFMQRKLEELYTQNPNTKAYGQFGRCHTQLTRTAEECNYYYFNSLASRLNKSDVKPLKGKVFSCPIFYPYSSSFSGEARIDKSLMGFAEKVEKNKIMVFALDSAEFPIQKTLAQRFSAVIINKLQQDRGADGTTKEEGPFASTKSRVDWSERLLLLGEAGIKGYDFSKTNATFGTNYTNQQQFAGFSLGYAENYGFSFGTHFHWFIPSENQPNDSTTATLKGYSIAMHYAKDVMKNKRYNLNIGLGYGFEQWTNTIVEEFTDESRKDILGNNRTTVFTNPALFVQGGLDFRVHIEWVTIGVFGRYQFDFSRKGWIQNGRIPDNSPRFSLSSYTVGASLGINIDLY